jgi:hypothetical protein
VLLAPVRAAPAPPTPATVCIVSRHSGEVLSGADFDLAPAPETRALAAELGNPLLSARSFAEVIRVAAESRPIQHQAGPDFEIDVDTDRVMLKRPGTAVERPTRGEEAVEVQVFGLVGPEGVSIRCNGRGSRTSGEKVEAVEPGWATLASRLRGGSLLCSGGAWQVRVAGGPPRPYAGVFSFRPLSPRQPEPGTTRREARARRGSEVIFRTTLSAYVSGVMAAEHAGLGGEAGLALTQVIAHDARVERHPGRPLCDTTHCQAFLGTSPPTPEVARALALPDLPTTRWLPYFRGGNEPWEVLRPAAEVRAAIGEAEHFGGNGRVLDVVRSSGVEHLPCEPVRAVLRLPGCPTEGVFEGESVRIRGRGRGHGLGLDVDAARASGLSAPELLRRAYGLR